MKKEPLRGLFFYRAPPPATAGRGHAARTTHTAPGLPTRTVRTVVACLPRPRRSAPTGAGRDDLRHRPHPAHMGSATQLLRGQLSAALRARWSAMVAMAVQDATAATLTGAGCGALRFASGPVPAWGEVGDDVRASGSSRALGELRGGTVGAQRPIPRHFRRLHTLPSTFAQSSLAQLRRRSASAEQM